MTAARSGPSCSAWRALERAERVDQAEIREWVARARVKLEAEMGAELARQACDAVAAMFAGLVGSAERKPVMQELEARRQRLPSREVDRFNAAVRERAERLAATDELEARRQVLDVRRPSAPAHVCETCGEACSCDLSTEECAEACHALAFGEASS